MKGADKNKKPQNLDVVRISPRAAFDAIQLMSQATNFDYFPLSLTPAKETRKKAREERRRQSALKESEPSG